MIYQHLQKTALTMITNLISRRLINADINVIQAFAGQVLVAPIFIYLIVFQSSCR